jgi:hypothetical protein
MSLHMGIRLLKLIPMPLNLRSISGTSARNRGDAKGLPAIAVDSGAAYRRR